jgi:hypothetical protein
VVMQENDDKKVSKNDHMRVDDALKRQEVDAVMHTCHGHDVSEKRQR